MGEETASSFSETDVIAPGKTPQRMQLPSPVYFARWVDERHAILGAGGGGRRFGMVNLLAIVEVDSTQRQGSLPSGGKPQRQQLPQRGQEAFCPWKFVTAIDMGANIPWCASAFLVCTDKTQLALGVVGYLAVSHITCFTLVEARRCRERNELTLQRLACIPLPSDPKNPDKKPIALVQGAVVVAHDEGGVHVYALQSLLKSVRPSVTEDGGKNDATGVEVELKETELLAPKNSDQKPAAAALPWVVKEAEPIAVWTLPARVNDLHANRFFVPKKEGKTGRPGPLLHSDYLLIAALVQDKTLRLATMKLRQNSGRSHSDAADRDGVMPCAASLSDACMFTGKDCRIPFSLMKSSMRLVQVFGVENIVPSVADVAWVKARRLHCAEGTRGAMPIANFVVVVYDVVSNRSYMLTARVACTVVLDDDASSPKDSGPVADAGKKPSKKMALHVVFAPQLSFLVGDAVTSISPCFYRKQRHDGAAVSGEGVGTVVPSHWLVSTVEGSLLSLEYGGNGDFRAVSMRPSKNKQEAKRFPALHGEPISCVAVSALNDVLTTDIAQNVVVSVLPFLEEPSGPSLSCGGAMAASSSGPRGEDEEGGLVERREVKTFAKKDAMTTALATAPPAGGPGENKCVRSKCEALLLFPLEYERHLWWWFLGDNMLLTSRPVTVMMAVVVVPVILLLVAYFYR